MAIYTPISFEHECMHLLVKRTGQDLTHNVFTTSVSEGVGFLWCVRFEVRYRLLFLMTMYDGTVLSACPLVGFKRVTLAVFF
jgi:hypothetical protein